MEYLRQPEGNYTYSPFTYDDITLDEFLVRFSAFISHCIRVGNAILDLDEFPTDLITTAEGNLVGGIIGYIANSQRMATWQKGAPKRFIEDVEGRRRAGRFVERWSEVFALDYGSLAKLLALKQFLEGI